MFADSAGRDWATAYDTESPHVMTNMVMEIDRSLLLLLLKATMQSVSMSDGVVHLRWSMVLHNQF